MAKQQDAKALLKLRDEIAAAVVIAADGAASEKLAKSAYQTAATHGSGNRKTGFLILGQLTATGTEVAMNGLTKEQVKLVDEFQSKAWHAAGRKGKPETMGIKTAEDGGKGWQSLGVYSSHLRTVLQAHNIAAGRVLCLKHVDIAAGEGETPESAFDAFAYLKLAQSYADLNARAVKIKRAAIAAEFIRGDPEKASGTAKPGKKAGNLLASLAVAVLNGGQVLSLAHTLRTKACALISDAPRRTAVAQLCDKFSADLGAIVNAKHGAPVSAPAAAPDALAAFRAQLLSDVERMLRPAQPAGPSMAELEADIIARAQAGGISPARLRELAGAASNGEAAQNPAPATYPAEIMPPDEDAARRAAVRTAGTKRRGRKAA